MSFTGNFIGVAEDFQLHVRLNDTASKKKREKENQVKSFPYSSQVINWKVQRTAG